MGTVQKFDSYAIRILGIILGGLIGAAVNKILGIQGSCNIPFVGWSLDCFWVNLLIIALFAVLGYVGARYSLIYGLKYINWKKNPKRTNIELLEKPARGNKLFLYNKEWRKREIAVGRVQIGDKDRWYADIHEPFLLSRNRYQEIPFIEWDKTNNCFSFIKPANDEDIRKFGVGEYEFDVAVMYDSDQKLKWFTVPISFDENNGIRIGQIKHADKAK